MLTIVVCLSPLPRTPAKIVELLLVGCQGTEVICEPCPRPDTDVRDQHPEKLHELIEAFDQAA